MLLAALAFVSGVIGMTACSTGQDLLVEPVFAAEVTGAVTRSAAGVAAFGVVREGGSTGFTLVMEDETGVTIVLQKPAIARPVLGTYPIVPRDEVGPLNEYRGVVRIVVDGALEEFEATAGTIIVTEDGPTFMKGTIAFQAVRTSPCCDPAPVTISVAGSFTAVQGPVAAAR